MTRYILYLSKIAAEEASYDPELEYHMSKSARGRKIQKEASGDDQTVEVDLAEVPEYTISSKQLTPIQKKKAA